MHYQVVIKSIPAYTVLSIRKVISNYYAEGELWKLLSEFARRNHVTISDSTFTLYHDKEYKEENVDVELCAPVKTPGKSAYGFVWHSTPPIAAACTMVYGDFSNIAGAYLTFAEWLQQNTEYKMTGPNRQIVHRGPWNETNPAKYLTEIPIPV